MEMPSLVCFRNKFCFFAMIYHWSISKIFKVAELIFSFTFIDLFSSFNKSLCTIVSPIFFQVNFMSAQLLAAQAAAIKGTKIFSHYQIPLLIQRNDMFYLLNLLYLSYFFPLTFLIHTFIHSFIHSYIHSFKGSFYIVLKE